MMRPAVPWVIRYAVALHVCWGLVLMLSPDAVGVTAIAPLAAFLPRWPLAVAFLFIGSAAGLCTLPRWRRLAVWLAMPQQVVLTISAIGAILCVMSGSYADLEPRPRLFILADQLPAILAAGMHGMALMDLTLERDQWPIRTSV